MVKKEFTMTFLGILNGLLNRIGSVFNYRINIVYALRKDFF